MFIAAAPGIQSARLAREVSTLDFAPTFATMFGVDATRFDGQAIASCSIRLCRSANPLDEIESRDGVLEPIGDMPPAEYEARDYDQAT